MRPLRLLAAAALLLGVAPAAEANTTSSNWAGYAAHGAKLRFKRVTGAWTVPAVACSAGTDAWSANWVGLGGFSATSQALEQAGTESDCDTERCATYSAWYELVPAASRAIPLVVQAGDRIVAGVTVSGRQVRIRLADLTSGRSFTRTLRAAIVDTGSAEWIVEAPSRCRARCLVMPLANFGTTGFTSASATTRSGHRGAIADSHWATTPIDLSPDAQQPRGPSDQPDTGTAVASATTSALNATATAFSLSYAV